MGALNLGYVHLQTSLARPGEFISGGLCCPLYLLGGGAEGTRAGSQKVRHPLWKLELACMLSG
jgi:hypothetical protein